MSASKKTQKYTHKLLLALIGSSKDLQEKTLSAVYEMGKDGDFSRTGNKKVDARLEILLEDEDMPEIIGDIDALLDKKIKTHLSKTRRD